MKKSYNERLHARNAASYTDAEKKLIKKQNIIKGLKDEGYDVNDQLAIIFNVLESLVDSIPDSDHRTELVDMLEKRTQVKSEASD